MSNANGPSRDWVCNYYSIGLPLGEGQGDVAGLLRHVAESIDSLQADGNVSVLGLNFSAGEVNEFGDWPSMVVFYALED
ncbi:hypothetical protein ACVMYR_18835 [Micromonospora sp. PTRAS2]